MRKLILIIVLLAVVIFISGCISQKEKTEESSKLDAFAKCLTENGVKMYSSVFCKFCDRQKDMFGSSFRYVEEIECDPRGPNPQTQLCLQKDIPKTPTWILERNKVEIKRLVGLQSLETFSEFSGCPLEEK